MFTAGPRRVSSGYVQGQVELVTQKIDPGSSLPFSLALTGVLAATLPQTNRAQATFLALVSSDNINTV